MRKKLTFLILTAVIAASLAAPAMACTPSLDLDIWGDLTPPSEIEYTPSEDIDKACDNAAKKWLEEHPIEYTSKTETETDTETETETEAEAEAETESSYSRYTEWQKYIPESLRNRWASFLRR